MTRLKGILANVALFLGALGITFALGEVAVRVLYKEKTVLFPRYHTDYRYGPYTIRGIRPHADYWMTSVDGSWRVVTNSRGFRSDREFAYPKPAGRTRVLVLGDSHTQGYEVRQEFTFSEVLQRVLAGRGQPAEAMNAGVSGFSTAEQLVFLENEGAKYAPDAVVLGFYANDFEDNLKAGLFGLDAQGRLKELKYEHIPGVRAQNFIYALPATRWLSENSYFYSLLFNNVWEYFKAKLASSVPASADQPQVAGRADAEYAVSTSESYTPYQIELAAALIERMHRFCAERGARFIVVDIPRPSVRYRYNRSAPPELVARLEAAGIELISSQSLVDAFAGAAELHLPHGNRHISEFTHVLIGTEVARRLLAPPPGLGKRFSGALQH